MNEQQLEKLRYPIGRFTVNTEYDHAIINKWIDTIEQLPLKLRKLVSHLSEEQLDTPYRPGGWKIRQVVHHLVDSHVNSFVRFKLTLTENKPTVKAYHEDRWAELADHNEPIGNALDLIEALHKKWVVILKSLTNEDLQKCFIHPETGKEVPLKRNIALYAWHCNHHYAHIENLIVEKGW